MTCHGIFFGRDFDDSQITSRETCRRPEEMSGLAPLHDGAALTIADSCIKLLPGAVNVAFFESQFHAALPAHISTHAIDRDVARTIGLRQNSFHGISSAMLRMTDARARVATCLYKSLDIDEYEYEFRYGGPSFPSHAEPGRMRDAGGAGGPTG
ncbi:hypothetical protein RJ55_08037 [Drechmeria coniospora]|nr:hypothetical protein RJ55_08037 [Drechmeria coniospora]